MNRHFKSYYPKKKVETSWWTLLAVILGTIILVGFIYHFVYKNALQLNFEPLKAYATESLPDPCELDSVVCDTEETPEQIIRRLGGDRTDYLLALAQCESSMRPDVISSTGDYGIFQINIRWNPEVTAECALDVACSTLWTLDQIKNGNSWKWVCSRKI